MLRGRENNYRLRTAPVMPTGKSFEPTKEAFFRTLVATAVDGIIVVDARGLVRFYNEACELLFGYKEDEVVGRNIKMLLPAPRRAGHDRLLSNHWDDGCERIAGIGREVEGRHKDQTTFAMYRSIGAGKLDGRKVFIWIVHGLADRKQADGAGEQSEARLRAILDTVPEAIVIIDEMGLIESFSPVASRLFGYAPAAVIGKNVKILMPSPYRDQHDGHLSHYRRDGEKRVIGKGRIVVGQRRDGSTFPMELAIGEVLGGGRRLFAGFMRDITERQHHLHELQTELLHVSRLSAMGQMTAAIAHELNQPLTAVTNYVKAAKRTLASMGIAPAQVARAQELMEKAANQTLRAGGIIRNLRDFVEKREGDRATENLNKVVEEAVALGFVGAADRNVKLCLDLDASLPSVTIDKIQIQQVLINLIRNSLEAMAATQQKELTLSTGSDEPGFARVTVADTGPGLAPDVSLRLFQPFVTTKEKGMGIGLTICQSIVDAHGGRIWARRDVRAGAAFCVRLPLAPRVEAAA